MIDVITKINTAINDVVWGWPALILLGFVGILMTVLTKFFQLSHFKHWVKNTIGAIFKDKHVTGHTKDKSISQFQSLCTALAATVGTGNIVGVATAIATGGPGAVFWMWIIAFFGMMTNYSENVLGILYRRKDKDGAWHGGAMYYLRDGLGSYKHCKNLGKILAVLFSVFCLLASFGIGNMSQVNSMTKNVTKAAADLNITIPNIAVGIFLFIAIGSVVVGGLKRIARITEKVVPFMVIIYFIGAIVIICSKGSYIPAIFKSIIRGAFAMKAVGGGIVGSGVALAMKMGFKRGIFSNEAGLGSSVMVHSSSNVKEPVRQGMWGIFEVFADTIIVCTLTALVILGSGAINLDTGIFNESIKLADGSMLEASALVSYAFSNVFGAAGSVFVALAVLLFAYSTVLGWSHYGSTAVQYLWGNKAVYVYRFVFCALTLASSVMTATLAWDISDTFNGLMMLPNLIGVLALSPMVAKCTKNYVDRHFRNKDVKPMLSAFEDIEEMQARALSEEGDD